MRLLIALAAIAVLGCSATDLMMFSVTMSSINTALTAAESAENARRIRQLEAERAREPKCECREEQRRAP